MANFCQKCGKALTAGAKFCTACGTPVPASVPEATATEQSKQPEKPQGKVGKNAETAVKQFAPKAAQTAQHTASQVTQRVMQKTEQAVQSPFADLSEQFASSETGEIALGTFGDISDGVAQVGEILNPLKTILQSAKGVFSNITGIFKNKEWKKLIIAGVLAVVWIVLTILSECGINIGILNWLTFARGGMGRGVFGWVGGLLGKTTVAAAVYAIAGGGFQSLKGGFKKLLSADNFKTNNLAPLLLGAGGALMIYQCFAGNAYWTDTMSAISGGVLSVMALGGNGGFISRLAESVTAKVSGKVRTPQSDKSNVLLSGVTYGFALGAMVSLIPFGWMPVILGGACVIAGVVLTIVFGDKKEVPAQ